MVYCIRVSASTYFSSILFSALNFLKFSFCASLSLIIWFCFRLYSIWSLICLSRMALSYCFMIVFWIELTLPCIAIASLEMILSMMCDFFLFWSKIKVFFLCWKYSYWLSFFSWSSSCLNCYILATFFLTVSILAIFYIASYAFWLI